MKDLKTGADPALLPAVLLASGMALTPAIADTNAAIDLGGTMPAVMAELPGGFALPAELAAYERAKTEEMQISLRMLWPWDDEPVNRCGTTSGCRSGWDDSDCF